MFGPWVSRKCKSISCIIVSTRISGSILPIRIIVRSDSTWARNKQNYLARLNCTGRRPQKWTVSLVDSSWASWHIWQIGHLVTEIRDYVKGCPKQWDQSWRVTARWSHLDFEVRSTRWIANGTATKGLVGRTAQKQQQTWKSDNTVRRGSHWGGSPQNRLRNV